MLLDAAGKGQTERMQWMMAQISNRPHYDEAEGDLTLRAGIDDSDLAVRAFQAYLTELR
jgi:hypothetical protein